jgi:ribonuclease-3 family protein
LTASPPEPAAGAAAWLQRLQPLTPSGELGVLQLAWLGDAVWELHQRLHHCQAPARAQDLHRQVVASVRAEAQARLLDGLDPWLRGTERELVRRARNRAGRGPRGGDPSTYARATGFEALLGWLFLHDPQRLVELLDHLEDNTP